MADIRFAVRTLLKTPGLTAVAVGSLALALGFTTAAFTVVHGAFLSSLPLPAGDRLVIVQNYDRSGRFNVPMTASEFTERQDRSTVFDGTAAWYSRNVTVSAVGDPAAAFVARAAYVSTNALELAGIAPDRGRLTRVADVAHGSPPVVLLSDDVWRNRFGADAGLLDRSIAVGGRPHLGRGSVGHAAVPRPSR